MRRHSPRVIRLCASLLSDPIQGEDAAQDVFLKAYRELAAFRREAAFSTWLYRIAYRRCADIIRSRARQAQAATAMVFETPPSSPPPEDAVAAADYAVKILASLPEESRSVLLLREVEDLTYEETAAVLDCSLEAVKSRLRRARELFLKKARSL